MVLGPLLNLHVPLFLSLENMETQEPASGCPMTAGSECVPRVHGSHCSSQCQRYPTHNTPESSQLFHRSTPTFGREIRSGDERPHESESAHSGVARLALLSRLVVAPAPAASILRGPGTSGQPSHLLAQQWCCPNSVVWIDPACHAPPLTQSPVMLSLSQSSAHSPPLTSHGCFNTLLVLTLPAIPI